MATLYLDAVDFSCIPAKRFAIPVVAVDPPGYEGGLIWNSTERAVKYYDGTGWVGSTTVNPADQQIADHIADSDAHPQYLKETVVSDTPPAGRPNLRWIDPSIASAAPSESHTHPQYALQSDLSALRLGATVSATEPSDPVEGMIWVAPTTAGAGEMKVRHSDAWLAVSGGGSSQAPLPPTGLAVTTRQATNVVLAWTNPEFGATGLIMRRAVGAVPPADPSSGTSVAITGLVETATVTGLSPNTTYSFSLWSRNAGDVISATPATVTVTTRAGADDYTAPDPVTALTAWPSYTQVVLTWTLPASADLASVIVRRADGATPPATASDGVQVYSGAPRTTVTDTSLPENSTYSYSVFAADAIPNVSAPVSVTTLTLGAPVPGDLTLMTTGATFSPSIRLHPGATGTITWYDHSNNVLGTGLTPTIGFGTPAVRTVRMHASLARDVHTINLGFNREDDIGRFALDASYNHASQAVSSVSGIQQFPALVNFCAASTQITSNLNFTGLAMLEFVECFMTPVSGMTASGCTSLIRLCYEGAATTSLELNSVASSVRDLRAAIQSTGSLNLQPQTAPLEHLYHFCVRDQPVTNFPSVDMFPALEEMWGWHTEQSGTLVLPANANEVRMGWNNFTALDLSRTSGVGGRLDVYGSKLATITGFADGRRWDTIILSGCGLTTAQVDAICNQAAAWGLDAPLALNLGDDFTGTNQPVSSASQDARNALVDMGCNLVVNKPAADGSPPAPHTSLSATATTGSTATLSWTRSTAPDYAGTIIRYAEGATPPAGVNDGLDWAAQITPTTAVVEALRPNTQHSFSVFAVDDMGQASAPVTVQATTGNPPTGAYLVWTDSFNRPDGAVGNGWVTEAGTTIGITAKQLRRGGSGGYRLSWNPLTGLAIPRNVDMALETRINNSQIGSFMGIMLRFNPADRTGVRVMTSFDAVSFIAGNSTGWDDGGLTPITTAAPPADWGSHPSGFSTLRAQIIGTTLSVLANGAVVRTYSVSGMSLGALAETGVGICGENGTSNLRAWDSFSVYRL